MNRPATLAAWLAYLETLHPKTIALGLERVKDVHARMDASLACPVITVTGTNGKGSTCAMLEAILRSAGYSTGLYSSPHLLRYNERVRISGEPQDDAAIVDAFNAVEDARGDTRAHLLRIRDARRALRVRAREARRRSPRSRPGRTA